MKINFFYRRGSVWPWSMGRGFEKALQELGHDVNTFICERDSGHQVNQFDAMLEFVKTPCDLFIVMGGGDKYAAFNYDTMVRDEFMKLNVPKLAYFMEGMESRSRTKIRYEKTICLWTHILTCDETDVDKIKALGGRNVAYAPGWVDEKVFFPQSIEPKHEFQFIGFVHKHREPYVTHFQNELGMRVGSYQSLEEYVNGINETKIVIGLPTVMRGFPQRVSETLACGKLLIHNRPPKDFKISHTLFEDRKHIVLYDTMEEAVALAKYYSEHDEERKEIERNARQEILNKHTVLMRAREFVNYATYV